MDCLTTTLKYMVLLFNLLFFVLGNTIIGVGIYMQFKISAYVGYHGNITSTSTTIFVIIGVTVTIISLFGCCGAKKENAFMMYTFGTLVALILLVEVVLMVVIVIYKDKDKQGLKKHLKWELNKYNSAERPIGDITIKWNELQQNYQCCGLGSPNDWAATEFGKRYPHSIPDSCCRTKLVGCGKDKLKKGKGTIYTKGCFEEIASDIKASVDLAVLVGGILGAIQLIAILVSCCFGRKID